MSLPPFADTRALGVQYGTLTRLGSVPSVLSRARPSRERGSRTRGQLACAPRSLAFECELARSPVTRGALNVLVG
jgi:hypothetical protein